MPRPDMTFRIVLFACSLLSFTLSFTQNLSDPGFIRSTPFQIQRVGQTDLRIPSEDWFATMGNTRVIPAPGLDQNSDPFVLAKMRANAQRDSITLLHASQKTGSVTGTTCSLGLNWRVNPYDGSVPSDHGIAVSDSGYIVTVANSTIRAYTISGGSVATVSKSLNSFVSISSAITTYDPKVTYDPVNKRFIVVFLRGNTSSDNFVYVAFSQYQDPTKTWNIYAIDGTFGNTVWTDFPQIGISNTELFISGNKFTNAGASQGATIWQLSLSDGYAGLGTVTTVNHNGAQVDTYFSLHPVQGAYTMYGPHFYFLSNTTNPSGSTGTIRVHKMSNTISAGGTMQSPVALSTSPTYSASPDADQSGTSMMLNTNDCRIQDSFLENDRIEFVFNSGNAGTPSIYWGTVTLSPIGLAFSSCSGHILNLGSQGIHLGYPGIAYSGEFSSGTGKNGVFICVNYAGPDSVPGTGAFYCDTDGNLTDMLPVYSDAYINAFGSSPHRWGDYAQATEMPGHPGEAWVIGAYGSTAHNPNGYMGQIFKPGFVGLTPGSGSDIQCTIFPNPANDMIRIQFPVEQTGIHQISITDLQGQVVHELLSGRLKAGEGMVQFNTTYLPAGTYQLVVRNESGAITTRPLVVVH